MDVLCTADMCPVILNATCVFYEGNTLLYTGITTNDNLQTALQKIDAKFGDAMVGYTFTNGVYQSAAGAPVGLGGNLIANTSIGGNFTLTFAGNVQAAKHITTGGTASQFVKGDGTLDSTAYQAAGNYITALTGDVIADGPGSVAASLAVVNSNPGTYGSGTRIPVVTVDTKGRVTALTTTAINVPSGSLSFVGDVYGSGTTGSQTTLTLTNVNTNVYTNNTFLKFKVNAKGLVTGAAPVTHVDIEGVLGYVPVPETRTLSINGVTHDLQSNISWTIATGVSGVTASAPLSSSGGATPNISIPKADASTDGYLDNVDWVTFNNKVPTSRTLTINGTSYDLSADRSWTINSMVYPGAGIAVSTGTAWGTSIVDNSANWNTAYTERISSSSSPLSILNHVISIAQATGSADGYLSSTDWNTFNNKQPAGSYVTTSRTISTTGPLQGGGDLSADRTLSITQAGASTDGYLSSTDWTTFNSKQGSGDYITALTGEATATGPGSATVTLSTPAVTGKLLTGVNITGGSVVATDTILEAFGKVQNQINGLIGGSIYKGTWNASTNTPTLTSGVGTTGWYYIVSVPGSTNIDGITDWNLGDWIIFDGTAWQQVDNTDAVVSVNGYTGAVSLVSSDIPEGLTNLYYTPARARTAISLTTTGTSGAATYDNLTGVLNVPVYSPDLSGYVPTTRTLTINGTGYDLSADRSWTVSGTMPAGGTAGQILAKIDATDYNTQWIDNFASQVKNIVKLGAALTKGTPVYVSGADGTNMIVSASSNTTEAGSSKTFGLLETGGALNAQVECVTYGLITGLDTSAAGAAGDPVWLGPNGTLLYGLANKPVAPAHMVYIGVVTRKQQNNGEIFVNIQNGFEIEELHDVLVTAPKTDGQGLFLQTIAGTQLWRNRTIADVLGYTPANDANVVHTTGNETVAGVKTFSNNVKIDGDLYLKQDGVFGAIAGYNAITADAGGFFLRTPTTTIYAYLAFNNLTTYHNYSFPDATGTLALTSDIIPYSLPIATASVLGGIKVGSNLSINATTGVLDATYSYTLPTASTTVLGGVKVDGTTITINATTGVISGTASYSLPIATASVLGGVKIGSGVSVDAGGVISVSTSYVASRGLSNWNDSTVIGNVVGMLAWKNYGNNHIIFDASAGTSPSGSVVNATNANTAWASSYPTLMGWNGSSTYGVRVDSARVADSASNSTSLGGFDSSTYIGKFGSGNGYYQVNNWIQVNANTGIFWPSYNGAHIYPNTSTSYGSIRIDGTRNSWRGITFDGAVTLMMNDNESGHYKDGSGWQFRWYQGTMYTSRSTYGGGTEYTVWDSGNLTNLNQLSNGPGYITAATNVQGIYLQSLGTGSVNVNNGSTAVYRNENGNGGNYAYAPVLHLGGSDTMWQIQGEYGGGTGLKWRSGYAGTWYSWWQIIHTGNLAAYINTLYYNGSSTLYTGSDGTRNTGWAYHNNNNTGLHWPNNGWHFYPKDTTDMYLRSGGSESALVMNANGTNRGYVYADSSNQIGFLNNGRSWIFKMTNNGDAIMDYNYGNSIVGIYSSTRFQGVFAMGNAYKLAIDGTSPGNLYGLSWSHPNAGGQAGYLNDHGLLVMVNGVTYSALSSNIWARGRVTANENVYSNGGWFYSYNNAGWYNETYGQGLRQAKGNVTYGNVIPLGENYNGWGGYNITNTYLTCFMQNSSGTHGFYQEGGGDGWTAFYNFGYKCWGLGTDATDPSYSLHIIKYGGSNTGWIIWSDRRIKENIKTIDNALDKVLSLRGVYYNKIDDPNKERCVGYIAQEVMEVVPELVVYSEELDMYNMNYGPMVGMLTEAVKEHHAKTVAQQAEIDTLKEQVQTLLNYINNGI